MQFGFWAPGPQLAPLIYCYRYPPTMTFQQKLYSWLGCSCQLGCSAEGMSPVVSKRSPAQVLLLPIALTAEWFSLCRAELRWKKRGIHSALEFSPRGRKDDVMVITEWLQLAHKDHRTSCRNTAFIFTCSGSILCPQQQRSGQRALCVFSTFVSSHAR